uniref:ATP synthase protein MI25 n=1 Tax=Sciadopitys verticillata TaxID=28979 RepID=A0A8H2SES3_SCIVE|nr:ATP synthase subunit 4 [Sciadopitys verticillata]
MLFAAIPFIGVLSSKGILICNEETIVACCSIGFIILSQRSFGNTSKAIFEGRIEAIQRELQQFLNPNEVVSPESKEQRQLLRISLRSITPEIVESLPNETAHRVPKCERTVQAVSCRNLNVESATPPNAISSRRIRLRDDIVKGFHSSVIENFFPRTTDTKKAFPVEPIREGLGDIKMQEWKRKNAPANNNNPAAEKNRNAERNKQPRR